MAEPDEGAEPRTDEAVATLARVRRAGLSMFVLLGIIIVAAAAGGIWYAYELGLRRGIVMSPPLVKADPSPTKVAPDDPGGLEVPHQEKLVYETLDPSAEEPEVKSLLPPPEEPLPRPELVVDEELPSRDVPLDAVLPDDVTPDGAAAVVVEAPKPVASGDEAVAAAEDALAPPPIPEEPSATVGDVETPGMATDAGSQTRQALLAAYRVQIGSFRGASAAERAWARAASAHGDLLAKLAHIVVEADLGEERGVYHRVQAGPFADRAAALALCERLSARDQPCLVVSP
jgi:cell division protein FtsN